MTGNSRDRVTIDLRGEGPELQRRAASQGLTVAAYVRRLVLALDEAPKEPPQAPVGAGQGPWVKVTLRMPADHALLLTTRCRRAEVSQGAYVASLLVGQPRPPVPGDRRELLAALSRSTDRLAVLSTDLSSFVRMLGRVPSERLEPLRASMSSLMTDVKKHLEISGRLVAELQAAWRPPSRRRTSYQKPR